MNAVKQDMKLVDVREEDGGGFAVATSQGKSQKEKKKHLWEEQQD